MLGLPEALRPKMRAGARCELSVRGPTARQSRISQWSPRAAASATRRLRAARSLLLEQKPAAIHAISIVTASLRGWAMLAPPRRNLPYLPPVQISPHGGHASDQLLGTHPWDATSSAEGMGEGWKRHVKETCELLLHQVETCLCVSFVLRVLPLVPHDPHTSASSG